MTPLQEILHLIQEALRCRVAASLEQHPALAVGCRQAGTVLLARADQIAAETRPAVLHDRMGTGTVVGVDPAGCLTVDFDGPVCTIRPEHVQEPR